MSNINPSTRRVAVVDYGITVVSSGEQAPILEYVTLPVPFVTSS